MYEVPPSLNLAQAVAAYLPESVVAELIINSRQVQGSPALLVEPRCFEAVTMMVDITGFTPLCEALAKKGREGAEQVTEMINAFFAQALRPVQEQGGVIAKFGGDAFNAFFARRAGDAWNEVLQRALHSAFALQALVLDYEGLRLPAEAGGEEQLFRLYAKVGLSAGEILTFGVGIPDQHCDFQVAGAAFNEAAEAEHHANKGEIVLHRNFLARSSALKKQIQLGKVRERCYPVYALNSAPPAPLHPLFDLSILPSTALGQLLAQAVAFVPQRIYERLALGYLALPGEHRRVISLFVHFTGFSWIEDATAPNRFHDYYLAMLEEVERYGGNLNRISSGDKGDLLHIIFGAPISHEDDEAQAVRCALALQAVAGRFDFIRSQKIGLSSGFVFAGDIGSPTRHEYTVIGDSVNLSARLMQLAKDWTILIDAASAARLRAQFEFAPPRAVPLKGKSGLTEVCEVLGTLRGIPRPADDFPPTLPIYGREAELEAATTILQKVLAGESGVIAVSGEPGIGKSLFLSRLALAWQEAGGHLCHVSVLNYERGAFRLWAKWLIELFGLDLHQTVAARGQQFTQRLGEIAPDLEEWAPLWGELLDLELPEAPWLRALDRPTRRQRLAELTPRLLMALAAHQPLLLLGDDIHWADSASFELLDEVVPALKNSPLLLCLGFRSEGTPEMRLLQSEACLFLPLQALSADASSNLMLNALADREISPEEQARFIQAVNEMTGGNPFFIEELLNTLRAENLWESMIRGIDSGAPLSYNLQSLIMARLDALEERLREVVLAASVVGGHFSDEVIRPLLPPAVAGAFEGGQRSPLAQLYQLDLLRPERTMVAPEGSIHYRFRHALLQQGAYESLPFARRRVLHEEVGRYFEQQIQPDTIEEWVEQLAYHFERSNNDGKAVKYLARSAERSARLFANQEALRYYQSALQRATRSAAPTVPDRVTLLIGLGDVQAQTADFPAALESYAQAIAETSASMSHARLEQRRAEVLVRATHFDEALESIARAEGFLNQVASRRARSQVRLVRAHLAELQSTILQRQGKFASAREWAEQGLTVLGRTPESARLTATVKVKLYQALAAASAMERKMAEAQHALGQALRLSRKLEDPVTEGQLQLRLAILAMQQDQLKKASRLFQRALPMIEKTGARDRLAHVLLPGGETFLYLGEFAQAKHWLERGLELAEQVGTPYLICAGHYLVAWVSTALGEWDTALMHCRQSAALAAEHGLWDRHAEYLGRQGELWAYRGEFQKGEQLVQEAISSAEAHNLPATARFCYRLLAEIYYNQGLFKQATPCLRHNQVGVSFERTSNRSFTALRLAEWWSLSTLQGKGSEALITPDEAKSGAQEALTFFRSHDFKLYLPTAHRITGLVAWAQQQPLEALQQFERGLRIAKQIGHTQETARLLFYRSKLRLSLSPRQTATIRRDLNEAAALLAYLGAQPELERVRELLEPYHP